MIIANPLYDVVFKRMMENERVARFFIGTLLDENVVAVQVKPQEFTFLKNINEDDPESVEYATRKIQERLLLHVFRLDFIATIKTESGEYKKILVEIQKGWDGMDLMRFRNYLAEQYKKEDIVNEQRSALPITTIYILGFKLPEIESACIKVERKYKDLINGKVIDSKNDFIEKLTHDSYVVQVDRISDRFHTKLDKLLSVFEQKNFDSYDKTTKNYKYPSDSEDMKILTDILHHVGTDPEERKVIENEAEGWRTINAYFDSKQRQFDETVAELNKEKAKVIAEKDEALAEKDEALAGKDEALAEKDDTIAEITKEKDEALAKKDDAIAEITKEKEEAIAKLKKEKEEAIAKLKKELEKFKKK